jgi:hypothetical protein
MIKILRGAALALALATPALHAQAPSTTKSALTEDQMADTQEQLIKLLRVSPVLTEVIERDPSLLADQTYVSRTNPQLAEFLAAHPEVVRNPDFYLFNGIGNGSRRRHELLDRKIWPEYNRPDNSMAQEAMHDIIPMIVFLCVLAATLWLTRVFIENRRWNRSIKLQMETHAKLIDRFSSNAELLTYMDTDAGKKFLESGPVPMDFGESPRIPNTISRVLTPLQVGVVMSLLGTGFLILRNSVVGGRSVFLVTGMVILMPGLGFIISAGLTWLLAGRLGMIPASGPNPQDRV